MRIIGISYQSGFLYEPEASFINILHYFLKSASTEPERKHFLSESEIKTFRGN
jgi:hypothetical protein